MSEMLVYRHFKDVHLVSEVIPDAKFQIKEQKVVVDELSSLKTNRVSRGCG